MPMKTYVRYTNVCSRSGHKEVPLAQPCERDFTTAGFPSDFKTNS